MIFENINKNMDSMLEALRPVKEVEGLDAQYTELATQEARQDEAKKAFLLQRENDEIDQDNRIFDAQQ